MFTSIETFHSKEISTDMPRHNKTLARKDVSFDTEDDTENDTTDKPLINTAVQAPFRLETDLNGDRNEPILSTTVTYTHTTVSDTSQKKKSLTHAECSPGKIVKSLFSKKNETSVNRQIIFKKNVHFLLLWLFELSSMFRSIYRLI
jgi:hypothetical protein